jgi:hypothetical protein
MLAGAYAPGRAKGRGLDEVAVHDVEAGAAL